MYADARYIVAVIVSQAGFVQWVSAAFGERWGYVEGGVSWLSTVLDAAIYPVMIKNYILRGQLWPGLESSVAMQNVFMIVMVRLERGVAIIRSNPHI